MVGESGSGKSTLIKLLLKELVFLLLNSKITVKKKLKGEIDTLLDSIVDNTTAYTVIFTNNKMKINNKLTLSKTRKLVKNVDNKIKEYGLINKCYIISFMSGCIEYIKNNYSNIKLQWLCSSNVNDNLDWCLENGVDIDINFNYCTKELVDKFHQNGLKVNIWTLNDETLLEKYLDMGVDMITSDWIIK